MWRNHEICYSSKLGGESQPLLLKVELDLVDRGLGDRTMKLAAIDLGTNTCLLLILELDPETGRENSVVEDLAEVVRLGEGVQQSGKFRLDAEERTLDCLKVYAATCIEHGIRPENVLAVSTAGARAARNSEAFFERVSEQTRFQFETISGAQEAQWMFEGALTDQEPQSDVFVIDIGGGSTEFQKSTGGFSFDVGSVFLTERFLKSDPVSDQEFWDAQHHLDELFEKKKTSISGGLLVGVAGTVTTLAALQLTLDKFDREVVDGCVLSRGDIHRWVEDLKWRSVEEKTHLPGMGPGRADVMLAGSLILWRAMEIFGWTELRVSTRGLRYGALRARAKARLLN